MLDVDVKEIDADPNHRSRMICRCSCGAIKTIRLTHLKKGTTKTCGNCKKGPMIEMVGKKFGRLTVVREKKPYEYPEGKRKHIEWYCKCDCGAKDVLVDGYALRSGKTRSCGCYHRDMARKKNSINLTGRKFGKLTVVRTQPKKEGQKTHGNLWVCRCECGNTTIVSASHLVSGHTKSCGCTRSFNEEKIIGILIKNNIKFKTQFSISDLVSKETGRKLKFDFAIFDNNNHVVMFIEYDGEQHFKVSRFSGNRRKNEIYFEKIQKSDELKNSYCQQNGFSLLRIPYTYEDQVEKLILGALREKGLLERND